MNNRAFTLLELLVVITIIGILSSIVIVSMSGSTDSATIAKGKAYAQQVHALLGHEAVLDFNFNENAYNTCPDGKDACDASGYGNHGIFYGNVNFADSPIDGYALSLDGTGDYIDCGNGASLKNIFSEESFTITVWFKAPQQIGENGTEIVMKYNPGFLLRHGIGANSKITGYVAGSGGVFSVNSSILETNEWYFIVLVRDIADSKILLYINSESPVSAEENAGNIYTNNPLYIGRSCCNANYFSGLVDEVKIYKSALSAKEIQRHYVKGLNKLLVDQTITKAEYEQRIGELKN
jgi:prepilin-type N-terminal cleavage/methylation domain-containing protein